MKTRLRLFFEEGRIEAGCDEAGRGCLAGPVVAAAVILPPDFDNELLDDSKRLTEKQRLHLRSIIERQAVAFAVGVVSNTEIDDMNILNASFLAMHRAIAALATVPQHLLIDGHMFSPYPGTSHTCIVGGDGKLMPIAAASVLAKTYRDDIMSGLHDQYPEYCWNTNKGYPTRAHRKAIMKFGITPLHRKTFRLTENQLKLIFE